MKTPDRRALRRIELKNLLSFGPDSPALELENLNILIGPNGSGKSNLIEAISLLRATPMSPASKMDLRTVVSDGGGTDEWIWKGEDTTGRQALPAPFPARTASIDAVINGPSAEQSLRHFFSFSSGQHGFRFREERIGDREQMVDSSVHGGSSVLATIRDPDRYPNYSHLTEFYEKIRIYREWVFGRRSILRNPQPAEMRSDRLDEDFRNLGLILSRLQRSGLRGEILDRLKDLYAGVTSFLLDVRGGFVEVFFEEGKISVPASRLSDGTLHYLCLLAILCDSDPPPLICLEEPELGLHPDILPKLADLLVEASGRTQLIVTTHSDVLVDAMTERPQAVVVCEKVSGQTQMKRLNKAELKPWLQQYRLGQLWSSGEIGGNRRILETILPQNASSI